MCKFCDNPKQYSDICHYDNGRGYNEKFGIGVHAWCGIKGNMFSIGGAGNRWTKADDYYESEGLDVDGESAVREEDGIAKFNYCPFCGKKLTDKTYENEIARRELPVIEKNLEILNKYKNFYGCAFRIQEYEKNPDKLKDKATIFIPIFSSERVEICAYHSSSRSLDAFDYDGYLPFSFSEWDLRYCIPYDKELFINLDKEFQKSWCGYQRHTGMMLFNNIKDIENLFDSIKEYNQKWKWNREKTLKEINQFHNDILNQITKLENRKLEIKQSLNATV